MVLAAAAALTGACVQSATGFGFALLLSPALFAVLDPYEAVTALLVLGLVLNLLVLADGDRRLVQVRALVPMLCAAVPGLALGVALLAWLPKPALQVAVGVAVVGAVAFQVLRRTPSMGREGSSLGSAVLVGFTTGALTTSVSVSGPPILLWLEARGLAPGEIRASLAAAFLALNLGGIAAVIASGEAGAVDPGTILPLVLLVALGHVVGRLAFRRLDASAFATVALALAAAAGVASIAAGLQA